MIVVLLIELLVIAAVVFPIFLVRKSLGVIPQSSGGFSISASSIGLWTLLLAYEVLVALIALAFASRGPAESFLVIPVLGFVTGVLMGSARMKPWEHARIGLAIGYAAAFPASVLLMPYAYIIAGLYPTGPDLVPLLGAAGTLSLLSGGACAVGSVLGGFLRSRWTAEPATA